MLRLRLLALLAVLAHASWADQTFSWGSTFTATVSQCEQVTVNNNGNFHNMYQVTSLAAYNGCTFNGAETQLALTSFASYTFVRNSFVTPGQVIYVLCEIAGHCSGGTKGSITVSSSVFPGYNIVGGECIALTEAPTTAAPTTAAPTTSAPSASSVTQPAFPMMALAASALAFAAMLVA